MLAYRSVCQSKVRLVGRTVVITGGNTGLGKETARDLYHRGARVVIACRNLEKAELAVEDIKKKPPSKPEREQFQGKPGELTVLKLDLCSFASVRECAKIINATEPKIHILINNAGVMMAAHEKTEDGNELHLQSNHLGHFLLTLLLLPKIISSAPGCRIICLSSRAHHYSNMHFEDLNREKIYTPWKAYGQSKIANILFMKELARKFKEEGIEGITTYSLHPGLIHTDLGQHLDRSVFWGFKCLVTFFSKPFTKSVELGVQTTLHCAVDETAGKETGEYYQNCAIASPCSESKQEDVAKKLWIESLKMVGLPVEEKLSDLLKQL